MKKIATAVWLVLVCVFMSACATTQTTIDTTSLTNDLLKEVSFEDELMKMDDAMVAELLPLEKQMKAEVYIGSGATAEQIIVLESSSEKDGNKLLEMLNKRVEDQKKSFENYIPSEVNRLEKAIIRQKGNYAILCVSGDEKASEVIRRYFS